MGCRTSPRAAILADSVMNLTGKAGLVLVVGLLPGFASAQKKPLTIGIVTGQLQNPSDQ